MDKMRIQAGMPRCIYHEINDLNVSPRQHIARSLGGPVISSLLLLVTGRARTLTRSDSIAGETAKNCISNQFIPQPDLLAADTGHRWRTYFKMEPG